MDMVERACIAYNHILLNQPEDQRDQTLAMKAAIRAMLEGLEPDAYVKWDKDNDEIATPLYDLSAIKEAVK